MLFCIYNKIYMVDVIQSKSSAILLNVMNKIPLIFNRICENNKLKETQSTIFNSDTYLPFNLYFKRLIDLIEPEVSTIILSFIYIDMICKDDNFIVSCCNVNNVFFTALYLSIKINEDEIFDFDDFHYISMINKNDIILFDNDLINLLSFKVIIPYELYEFYYRLLEY